MGENRRREELVGQAKASGLVEDGGAFKFHFRNYSCDGDINRTNYESGEDDEDDENDNARYETRNPVSIHDTTLKTKPT